MLELQHGAVIVELREHYLWYTLSRLAGVTHSRQTNIIRTILPGHEGALSWVLPPQQVTTGKLELAEDAKGE